MVYGVWCMVGFCHWHIPTFIITDISPPWWDFVMVGICWVTMTMVMMNDDDDDDEGDEGDQSIAEMILLMLACRQLCELTFVEISAPLNLFQKQNTFQHSGDP